MSDNSLDRAALRRKVEEEIVREKRNTRVGMLVGSIVMYLGFMLVCWGNLIPRGSWVGDQGVVIFLLSLGWSISLLFQIVSTMLEYKAFDRQIRQRAIGKAVERELMEGTDDVKAKHKRDAIVSLSDDGELVYEEAAQEKKQAKGN
jgi:hypothetical protein